MVSSALVVDEVAFKIRFVLFVGSVRNHVYSIFISTSESYSSVDMSAMRLSAKMDRTDNGTPWGFRMTGGKDFGAPLIIQRVSHCVYELDE